MERDFDFLRMHLAALLRRDAALHRIGRHDLLGHGLAQTSAQFDENVPTRYGKFVTAVSFWGAWIVARNTEWRENDHIAIGAWPRLAERVAEHLEQNRDITDHEIIRTFDVVTPSTELEATLRRGEERCVFGPDALEAYDFSLTDTDLEPAATGPLRR